MNSSTYQEFDLCFSEEDCKSGIPKRTKYQAPLPEEHQGKPPVSTVLICAKGRRFPEMEPQSHPHGYVNIDGSKQRIQMPQNINIKK